MANLYLRLPLRGTAKLPRLSSLLGAGIALPLSVGAICLSAWVFPADAKPSRQYGHPAPHRIYQPAPVYPSGISVQIGSPIYVNPGYNYPIIINRPINPPVIVGPSYYPAPYYPAPYYYPGVSTQIIQTYTRPSPEIVVDPEYGVRFKNPPGY